MDLSNYKEEKPHYIKRLVWMMLNVTLFRIAIGRTFKWLRHGLLRVFGAKIDKDAFIYPSCKVFMPWNLVCGRACIGPNTNIYNKDKIVIGNDSVISQGCFLCTAGHDTTNLILPLVTAPIVVSDKAWVAANSYIGMGVTIGEGAVVGACAAVFKDVEAWTIVGGNPAKFIKKREIKDKPNA